MPFVFMMPLKIEKMGKSNFFPNSRNQLVIKCLRQWLLELKKNNKKIYLIYFTVGSELTKRPWFRFIISARSSPKITKMVILLIIFLRRKKKLNLRDFDTYSLLVDSSIKSASNSVSIFF